MKIKKIKEKSHWYTMNGEEGIIIEPRDDMGWEDNEHGCPAFYPFSQLTDNQLEQIITMIDKNENPCRPTYDESYGVSTEPGDKITDEARTNYENEQKLVYNEFSLIDYAEADAYEREHIRTGGQYHDWTGIDCYDVNEHGDVILNEDCASLAKEAYQELTEEARDMVDWSGLPNDELEEFVKA